MDNLASLFLSCALSLTPAVGFNGQGHIAAIRILVVDGDPGKVLAFREDGINAFGAYTSDSTPATIYHAICDIQRLAFQYSSFGLVAVYHPNRDARPAYDWLTEILPLITRRGSLAFNPKHYSHWVPLMNLWGWKRLKTRFDGLTVYRRSA